LPLNKATLQQTVNIAPETVSREPAKTAISTVSTKQIQNSTINKNVFNALYNKPRVDEKKELRVEWKKVFHADVWFPYYKAKEIEGQVCEKFRVKVWSIKGKPELKKNQALYVFKHAF